MPLAAADGKHDRRATAYPDRRRLASACDDGTSSQHGRRAGGVPGAAGVIAKPFDPLTLPDELGRLLANAAGDRGFDR